jgi:tRNA(Ile)-lysidine synthase
MRGPCAVPFGTRVLVAVSGGADSTALLRALHRLAPEFGYRLLAAHLHHGLRGVDADADLGFVRALCERLEVPLISARWNTRERMRRRRLAGQDGLRRLRREFLERVARRSGANAIATAHTADDQLETLLLRLGRGAGLVGLGGIAMRRGGWIRPLLEASRAEIETDLRSVRQDWREDASNRDLAYARNRVRHEVVPALLRAVRGSDDLEARGALARRAAQTARELRRIRALLGREAATAWNSARIPGGRGLDCDRLRPYPYPIRRLLIGLLWSRSGSDQGLTRRHLDGLMELASSDENGRLDLPGRARAERMGTVLRIRSIRAGIEP